MRKAWTIARHEFLTTIRRRTYIILTLSFPLLALLGMLIYQGVVQWSRVTPAEEQKLGYVDETGFFDQYTSGEGYQFVLYAADDEAMEALLEEEVDEYFIIPQDYIQTGLIVRFTTEWELEPSRDTMSRISDFLLANLLSEEVSEEVLERAKAPMLTASYRLDKETGELVAPESDYIGLGLAYLFAILFMLSVFFTSGYLLQGVSEEKENRLIEILLSSVSARQLLGGKVLGLGAAGLLQILVWLLAVVILAAVASVSISVLEGLAIPASLIVFAIIYFILGYLLYGIMWTALGSMGATAREGSQLTALVSLPAVLPVMLMALFANNPDHALFTAFTLLPVTSPITVVMRLSLSTIPAWELAISIVLLVAAIILTMWLAARVFRTLLLMYGKRPTLGELWHYVREG